MNIKTVCLTHDPVHPGWKQFERSLLAGGVPHHLIVQPWTGFGCKISGVRNWLLGDGRDVDVFIFADAFDTFFLGSWEELLGKILGNPGPAGHPAIYDGRGLFSCEKAVWPPSDIIRGQYPPCDSPWRYINSGGYLICREQFLAMTEGFDFTKVQEDQSFFTACYLTSPFGDMAHRPLNQLREQLEALGRNRDTMRANIALDTNCDIFQSIAFEGADDFHVSPCTSRLTNCVTNTKPNFIHGNGRTPMEKIYALR